MLQVEDYEEMRRAYFCDEMSIREIAREFHHGRNCGAEGPGRCGAAALHVGDGARGARARAVQETH